MSTLAVRKQRGLLWILIDLLVFLGLRRLGIALIGSAAAATVATLTITGAVPQRLEITVTATAAAANMDLSRNQPAVKVADMVATTNWPFGYTVVVESENANQGRCTAACFYSASTTESLPLSLFRDSTGISFAGPSVQFVRTTQKSAHSGDPYAVQVAYDGTVVLLTRGTDYREVLTFTISNN